MKKLLLGAALAATTGLAAANVGFPHGDGVCGVSKDGNTHCLNPQPFVTAHQQGHDLKGISNVRGAVYSMRSDNLAEVYRGLRALD